MINTEIILNSVSMYIIKIMSFITGTEKRDKNKVKSLQEACWMKCELNWAFKKQKEFGKWRGERKEGIFSLQEE